MAAGKAGQSSSLISQGAKTVHDQTSKEAVLSRQARYDKIKAETREGILWEVPEFDKNEDSYRKIALEARIDRKKFMKDFNTFNKKINVESSDSEYEEIHLERLIENKKKRNVSESVRSSGRVSENQDDQETSALV